MHQDPELKIRYDLYARQKEETKDRRWPYMLRVKLSIQAPILLLLASIVAACSQSPKKVKRSPASSGKSDNVISNSQNETLESGTYFTDKVHKKLREHCAPCHESMDPKFAHPSSEESYKLLFTEDNNLVNLKNPKDSLLVNRLRKDEHRCWSDCETNAAYMENILTTWVKLENGDADLPEQEEDTQIADKDPEEPNQEDGENNTATKKDQMFTTFVNNLYPLLAKNCSQCHESIVKPNFASKNKELAYEFVINGKLTSGGLLVDQEKIANSGLVTRLRSDKHNCWTDSCEADASMMHDAIEKWLKESKTQSPITDTDEPISCSPDDQLAGSRGIRLLSNKEYRNTIKDLFPKIEVNISLTNDISKHNQFDNITAERPVQKTDLGLYLNTAMEIAKKISWDQEAPCNNKNAETEAKVCLESFLNTKGERIWRRPLTATEKTNLTSIFIATYNEISAKKDYQAGMEDTLTAMLVSNNFLYRTELGQKKEDGFYHLDPYEIASALSYSFWRTMPDDTLMDLAASKQIEQDSVIKTQISRLMSDNRFNETLGDFANYWLEVYKVYQVNKDQALFPEFTDALKSNLHDETISFFKHIIDQKGTYESLLSSSFSTGAESLANFYSAPYKDGKIQFNPSQRKGILSHASLLAANAYPDSPSPVHRGVFLIENLTCNHFPEPPAVTVPEIDEKVSNKDRFANHSEKQECAVCHDSIDQIGFSFENYDAIGRFRTTEYNKPIDAKGSITLDGSKKEYQGLVGLSELLSKSQDGVNCFSKQVLTFSLGRALESNRDKCLLNDFQNKFTTASPLKDIFSAHFNSPSFLKRK